VKDPRITVIYGRQARVMARTRLEEAPASCRPFPGAKILLKPNLVTDHPASTGATPRPRWWPG